MSWRRIVGALVLIAALAMVACGLTFLNNRLSSTGYVLYWTACFILTGTAVVIAFRDVRAVARETSAQQRDLVEKTFRTIESEAMKRKSDKFRN